MFLKTFMWPVFLHLQAICHIFAIALHYFFLATYSWVMNEAFNLYIVITYSTHNPSDLNDSGSMIRYYVLGWGEM